VSTFIDVRIVASLLFLLLICVLVVRLGYRRRIVWLGAAWIVLSLLPVYNIVPLSNIMASRYLYIPMIGFCFIVSGVVRLLYEDSFVGLSGRLRRGLVLGFICSVLLLYGADIYRQHRIWHDERSFWSQMMLYYPRNPTVHNKAGVFFFEEGKWDEAAEEVSYALRLRPDFVEALTNLGATYLKKKDYDRALEVCERAVEMDPAYASAYNNMGMAYVGLGDYEQAVRVWEYALDLQPGHKKVLRNLLRLNSFLSSQSE